MRPPFRNRKTNCRRILRTGFVLCIWMAASGSLLDLVQIYAWGRMWVANLQTQSAVEALSTTFSNEGACGLCKTLEKVRDGSGETPAATPSVSGKALLLPISLAGNRVVCPEPRQKSISGFRMLAPDIIPARPPIPPPRLV